MHPLYTEDEFNKAKTTDKLPMKCILCENTFYAPKGMLLRLIRNRKNNHGNTFNFCSIKCSSNFKNPPQIVECCQCKTKFQRSLYICKKQTRHFCSRSCSVSYRNAHKETGTRVSKMERWLQSELPSLYPNLDFDFNKTDSINAELDIYIPSLKLAFELNGIFHYEPIFGPEKLSKTQTNDHRKFQACIENGIELCIIDISSVKHFKIEKCKNYLEIITKVITSKLGVPNEARTRNTHQETPGSQPGGSTNSPMDTINI